MKDNSMIKFPEIGIAEQPSPSDLLDAPDNSPRGNFTVYDTMIFHSGTISGKVNINVLKYLFIDTNNNKYIRSLAKLINYGLTNWGYGNLIIDNNADFINYNELQLRNGLNEFTGNTFIQGTIVPVESGGDPLAQQYHSWDVDQGSINSKEYIKLQEKLISILPINYNDRFEATEIIPDVV